MRISGIENYIGGADNVKALSLIQGEQRILEGQILDSSSNPIDITAFSITATVDFYLADVTVTPRSMVITNLTPSTVTKTHTFTGVISDATLGKFKITVPKDFYVTPLNEQIEIDTDLAVDVPLAVMYLDYNADAASDASSIRSSRMVFVIRRGSPSVGL